MLQQEHRNMLHLLLQTSLSPRTLPQPCQEKASIVEGPGFHGNQILPDSGGMEQLMFANPLLAQCRECRANRSRNMDPMPSVRPHLEPSFYTLSPDPITPSSLSLPWSEQDGEQITALRRPHAMGACLCRGHKDLQQPVTVLWAQTEEGQASSDKEGQNPSNGSVTDKSSHYDIGELATSSLIGLVATIKEHITKPTAMAQGRVAHLIEWKGWGGGEAGSRGWSGAWGRGGAGMEAELQEDAHYYSQMTDEIKEARFAAGVAEQFALAEAAMNMWSMADGLEQPSTSLQVPHNHLLSQFLLDGGSMGVPQHLYSLHMYGEPNVAPPREDSVSPTTSTQPQKEVQLEPRGPLTAEASVRHVDSSSLSEDDVFYN